MGTPIPCQTHHPLPNTPAWLHGPSNAVDRLYLVNIVVLLNMSTMSGFTIINCVIGGQTLSAINGDLSVNVGIVIVACVALFISFFGYRVLYHYEKWAWIPTLISLVVATGFGGKYLANQHTPPPATAVPILSFGGLLAGFLIPWAALSSDYCAYFHPSVNSYVFLSFPLPGTLNN